MANKQTNNFLKKFRIKYAINKYNTTLILFNIQSTRGYILMYTS